MQLLYSNILPMRTKSGQSTIQDCIKSLIKKSDCVEIAVGYVSSASLEELDRLASEMKLPNICLNIGMYYIEGMPERSYHTAVRIHRKWVERGFGEVRLVRSFKYHGKIYCFFKAGKPFAAIVGSANLGVLKFEASNLRQYEISALTEDPSECLEVANFVTQLKHQDYSVRIDEASNLTLITENNNALSNVELVSQIPPTNVSFYMRCPAQTEFLLPLKVPLNAEKHIDDGKHYTKSNINVCYAAPRNSRKSRDWFETQLTVSKEITRIEGYPKKNDPFFIVTDDGYWFKAHTTSDGNKQFSAVGDELIMGRWLKGRLVAAGLVYPVNDTQLDIERKGMITREILQEYGCETLHLKKTGQTAADDNGNLLDVWVLSFSSKLQGV